MANPKGLAILGYFIQEKKSSSTEFTFFKTLLKMKSIYWNYVSRIIIM